MRLISWIFRALIFFILFAFALNNQHSALINWPFGYHWQSQTVFVVLGAFALGCAVGVFAMVPSWWRQRSQARLIAPSAFTGSTLTPAPADRSPEHPPRDGL